MIVINSVYLRVETNERFRILWINPNGTYAYVIDIKNKPKMPYEMLIEEIA